MWLFVVARPCQPSPPAHVFDPVLQLLLRHATITILVDLVNDDAKSWFKRKVVKSGTLRILKWLTLVFSLPLLAAVGRTSAPVLCRGRPRGRTARCVRGRLLHNAPPLKDCEALGEFALRLLNKTASTKAIDGKQRISRGSGLTSWYSEDCSGNKSKKQQALVHGGDAATSAFSLRSD